MVIDAENPFAQMDANANGVEPKKKTVPRVFTEDDLCSKPEGLNSLYTKFVIEQVPLKGKGHELSDLNKILSVYTNWHMQFAPKLQFEYAIAKISALAKKNAVSQHVSKLRSVYKGEQELFFEVAPKTIPETNKPDAMKPTKEFNIKDAQAQQAAKEQEQYFEMLDDRQEHVRIDTRQQLTDEQQRTMEMNRLRAIERKRERELKEQFEEQAKRFKHPNHNERFAVVHDNCDSLQEDEEDDEMEVDIQELADLMD